MLPDSVDKLQSETENFILQKFHVSSSKWRFLCQIPVRDSENSNRTKFISVTETIYVAIRRETGRIRKKAQRHGQCICPGSYRSKCDGNCDYCRYRTSGDSDYSLVLQL